MTTEPTLPVHPAGDVPGLPAVPGTNQRDRRRRPFREGRRRRRLPEDKPADEKPPKAGSDADAADEDNGEQPHIDYLA